MAADVPRALSTFNPLEPGVRVISSFTPAPKIDIDEFMNWFTGHDVAAERTPSSSSGGWPQEPSRRLRVKVRSNLAGGDAPTGGIEEGGEDSGDDHSSETGSDGSTSSSGSDGSGSSSEGSSSDSSAGSGSSTATGQDDGATGPDAERAATKQKKGLAVGEKGRGKPGGLFGVGAPWRRTKTTGANATGPLATKTSTKNSTKRKQPGEKKGQAEQRGGGEEGGEAKRRRHRRSAERSTGDESLAPSPPSANGALTTSPLLSTRAFVSPGRLRLRGLRRAGSPAVVDPWRRYGKTLRAVAEHEARTLLLRRARLRAQVSAFLPSPSLLVFVGRGVGGGATPCLGRR